MNVSDLMVMVEDILDKGETPEATSARLRFAFQVYTANQLRTLNGSVKRNRTDIDASCGRIEDLERDSRIIGAFSKVVGVAIVLEILNRIFQVV